MNFRVLDILIVTLGFIGGCQITPGGMEQKQLAMREKIRGRISW